MSTEKPFSIFGKSSHQKKEKYSLPRSIDIKDLEIDQMIKKMQEMHDEIEVKLDEIYQKSGLNPHTIKDYLDNPDNFSIREWERIQNQRQLLLEQMGESAIKKPSDKQQEAEKIAKERKTKTLGARRKWIPM